LTRALSLACFTFGEGSPTSATHWARAKSRTRFASSKVQSPPVDRHSSCTASRTCDRGSKKSLSPFTELQPVGAEHPSGAVQPFWHPLITNPVIDKYCELVINTRVVSGGEMPPTSDAASSLKNPVNMRSIADSLSTVAVSARVAVSGVQAQTCTI
jgi:hypothetical protein